MNAPAAVWLIWGDWVQELCAVNCFMAGNQVFLFLALNFSEVLPSLQFKCIICTKSLKAFVEKTLVKRCVFQSTLGDCAASSVDFTHTECQPVQLSHMFGLKNDSCHGVDHLGSFGRLNENRIKLPSEQSTQLFTLGSICGTTMGQAWEDKVLWGCPVEALGWELSFLGLQ